MTESITEPTLISTDVDFDQNGKQCGRLSVPQSTNSAGWAVEYIPVVVVRNGDGPTAVLFGGNHGDEFEGPVVLSRLARQLEPGDIRGRVIIIPMLNRPAVAAGTRLSPVDGANMNRAFPGRPTDSITGMIAHFVASRILPLADLVVDIHSGGSSMHMAPSVNMHRVSNADQMARMLDAGRAWSAPYVFIYEDVAGAGLLPSYAENLGKVTLGTEMGSKAQFGVETLQITARGVRNVLHWAGIAELNADGDDVRHSNELAGSNAARVTPHSAGKSAAEIVFVAADDTRDYIMSPVSGIFEPFYELGDTLTAGQTVGQVISIERPETEPVKVSAATDGILISRRSIPLTRQGECVSVLARPFDVESYS